MRILLLLMPLWLIGAPQINWYKDFASARKSATEQHKPIMVFYESKHCKWCKKMLSVTLQNSKIVRKLNSLVIAVKAHKEKEDYPKHIFSKYAPTIFFLDEYNQNIIRPILGYWDADSFIYYIKDLKRALLKRANGS